MVNWCTIGDRLPCLPDTVDLGVSGDDPVMIFFSSGTTGPQKAVMLSHRNIHAQFVISWSATIPPTCCDTKVFVYSTLLSVQRKRPIVTDHSR